MPAGVRRLALLLLPWVLAACGPVACGTDPEALVAGEGPEALAALAVEVETPAPGDTLAEARATFQTDRAGTAWYDVLAGPQDRPEMGLSVAGRRVLDGWRWWIDADSIGLGPDDRTRGIARPDFAVRSYMEVDTSGFVDKVLRQLRRDRPTRITERVTLLGGAPGAPGALLVEVPDSIGTVGFRPVRGDLRAAGEYRVRERDGTLLFARADQVPTDSTVTPEGPIWVAVRSDGGAVRATRAASDVPEAGREAAFRVGELAFPTPGRLVIATGPTEAAADSAARRALADAEALRRARSDRMASLLAATPFETEDAAYNMAFRWALLSLDALVQPGDSARTYLQAGLPGLEPASFPSALWTMGAFLDTGQWDTARQLLTTFGGAQRFDRRIDLLGRAPDLVPAEGEAQFRTADGTLLFLDAAGRYVRATGDRGLVSGRSNFWFKTVFALRGVYEPDGRNGNATDTLGFFVARENRGTWLEGDPELGAVVRRGAPVEAQGALYGALATATQFARIMGVSQRSSARWYADTSRVLVGQLNRQFVRSGRLVDRVGFDGGVSTDVRPNGLLALAQLDGVPGRGALARPLAEELVFPYGVASLSQSDSLFHPFLDAPAFYSPASARTGGAVWTWLAGPVATLMAETGGADPAWELMQAQARLLLDRGVVGAIPELVSGHPRADDVNPTVGGAPVQPWSLAGFLSTAYEGFLGAQYASADTLVLDPRLPESWGTTSVRLRLGDGQVTVRLRGDGEGIEAEVAPSGPLVRTAALRLRAGGSEVVVPLAAAQGDTLVVAREAFRVRLAGGEAEVGGETVPAQRTAAPEGAWEGFAFAEPALQAEYPVMRAVQNRRQLGPRQILRDNPSADVALTQTDPDGDDWGATSTFTYPTSFPPNVLDATYFEVARDDSTTYFRAEFASLAHRDSLGFQPTFVAIAIDTEEGGEGRVGRNALYDFPNDEGYEFVIYVGDGLLVEDAKGRELGRLGADGKGAFDPSTGSLSFAVPTFVIPTVARGSRVTLLVGANDASGGVGEFRSLERRATDKVGGGKLNPRSPNVYDVISGRVR